MARYDGGIRPGPELRLRREQGPGHRAGSQLGAITNSQVRTYAEIPDWAEADGFLFAKITIELANRLAEQAAP